MELGQQASDDGRHAMLAPPPAADPAGLAGGPPARTPRFGVSACAGGPGRGGDAAAGAERRDRGGGADFDLDLGAPLSGNEESPGARSISSGMDLFYDVATLGLDRGGPGGNLVESADDHDPVGRMLPRSPHGGPFGSVPRPEANDRVDTSYSGGGADGGALGAPPAELVDRRSRSSREEPVHASALPRYGATDREFHAAGRRNHLRLALHSLHQRRAAHSRVEPDSLPPATPSRAAAGPGARKEEYFYWDTLFRATAPANASATAVNAAFASLHRITQCLDRKRPAAPEDAPTASSRRRVSSPDTVDGSAAYSESAPATGVRAPFFAPGSPGALSVAAPAEAVNNVCIAHSSAPAAAAQPGAGGHADTAGRGAPDPTAASPEADSSAPHGSAPAALSPGSPTAGAHPALGDDPWREATAPLGEAVRPLGGLRKRARSLVAAAADHCDDDDDDDGDAADGDVDHNGAGGAAEAAPLTHRPRKRCRGRRRKGRSRASLLSHKLRERQRSNSIRDAISRLRDLLLAAPATGDGGDGAGTAAAGAAVESMRVLSAASTRAEVLDVATFLVKDLMTAHGSSQWQVEALGAIARAGCGLPQLSCPFGRALRWAIVARDMRVLAVSAVLHRELDCGSKRRWGGGGTTSGTSSQSTASTPSSCSAPAHVAAADALFGQRPWLRRALRELVRRRRLSPGLIAAPAEHVATHPLVSGSGVVLAHIVCFPA